MTAVSTWRVPRRTPMATVALVALLAACATPHAPVDTRGEQAPVPARLPAPTEGARAATTPPVAHTIARGDTLYSIAWRYGLDYRDVARWNGIADPYVIHPGRTLRLAAPTGGPVLTPRKPPQATTVKPEPPAVAPRAVVPRAATVLPSGPIRWQWPTRGRIVRSDSPTSRKGIDIAGVKGQAVHAAAAGAVVYSGSGLLGYGRLIILKHSDTFLSAYAYNEQLLASEGDRVTAGQQIATMGTGTSGQPMLHFEIRRDGKPVNPLEHLPRSD